MNLPSAGITTAQGLALERAGWSLATKLGHTVNGNGAQEDHVFVYTGTCEVLLYAEVATKTNSTKFDAISFSTLSDDGTKVQLTAVAGSDMNGCVANGWIGKIANIATAIKVNKGAAPIASENAAASFTSLFPVVISEKVGMPNRIDFCFTGDANTNLTINLYCWYRGLGAGTVVSA